MRNVWIITLAQAFAACGPIILISFGGIAGTRIAPVPALATMPLALSVVGVALTSIPAALLMQRIGRKPALIMSALVGVAAALLCAWAVAHSSFEMLCLGATLIGATQAFVVQYRFAATEYVPAESAGYAVSTVMLGMLGAAIIGPELGDRARLLGGWTEFTGSFVALGGLCLVSAAILSLLGPPLPHSTSTALPARPLRAVIVQPAFIVAVLAAAAAFSVMSFIMTATPISMHVIDHMSVAQTKQVIAAHLLGMYVPSLASGWLTRALGLKRMMLLGAALMGLCVVVAASIGQHFAHYFIGLVLLGVGWNLMFVAGTTLLTQTYSAAERFKAQGVNDFATFAVQAIVSLLAGTAIQTFGWKWVNLASLPVLVILAAGVLWLRARERRDQHSAAMSSGQQ